MKTTCIKLICIICTCYSIADSLFAQTINLYKRNDSVSVSGTTLKFTTYGDAVVQYVYVHNQSGSDVSWQVKCQKIEKGLSTYEDLCFGEENYSGHCQHFSADQSIYSTYNTLVRSNKNGEIKVGIKRFGVYPEYLPKDTGTILYQYSLTDTKGNTIDSFYMEVTFKNHPKSVGIETNENRFTVNLYPNPSSNTISIADFGTESILVTMFNAEGQKVLQTIAHNEQKIEIDQFASGLYTVQCVRTDGSIFVSKVLIQK